MGKSTPGKMITSNKERFCTEKRGMQEKTKGLVEEVLRAAHSETDGSARRCAGLRHRYSSPTHIKSKYAGCTSGKYGVMNNYDIVRKLVKRQACCVTASATIWIHQQFQWLYKPNMSGNDYHTRTRPTINLNSLHSGQIAVIVKGSRCARRA